MTNLEKLKAIWDRQQDVETARGYIAELEDQVRWLIEMLATSRPTFSTS